MVKSTAGISRIDLNKLVYSETDNHLQKLYMSDGKVLSARKSSTELFELLEEEPRFYKCGNTYIINMDYIVELSSKCVVFSTGSKIPILNRYASFGAGDNRTPDYARRNWAVSNPSRYLIRG